MQKSIYIKYTEQEWGDVFVWLSTLWKSLIAIEKNIDHCFKISKINWDLNTKIVETKKWSIIIEICLQISFNSWIAFESIQEFLDFLVMADYSQYLQYRDALTEDILHWYESLESFVAEHPIASGLGVYVTQKLWKMINSYFWIAKVVKETPLPQTNIIQPIHITNNYYCTPEQLQEIKSEVIKWSFNDVMLPLVEDEVSQIEVWTYTDNNTREGWLVIDEWDLWWYLSEWQEKLASFIDGWVYHIPWRITAMQVSRWESMQFKAYLDGRNRYLKLKATDPVENYRSDFNQDVILQAQIQRDSLYKKPTLLLQNVSRVAVPLFPMV